MNLQVEPPEKKKKTKRKKKDSSPPSSSPSFSLLPDEIAVNCLARISRSQYPTLSIVSKSFRSLVSSTELYAARSHLGSTEHCLYICLFDHSDKCTRWSRLWINPNRTRPDSTIKKKKKKKKTIGQLLVSIPCSNLPSLSTYTALAVGSEIYVIGGSVIEAPSSAVRVLDCRSHTWRDAPSMNVARKYAWACAYDGKIYVMEGCRGLEEDQPWAEVFDTKTLTWEGLPDPCPEVRKQTIYGIVEMEGKICFGYAASNTYAYDTKQGKWECRKGLFATLPSSKCAVMDNVSYSFGRKIRFGSRYSYGCWWEDVKDGDCNEVKGLESLVDMYRRNGGSNGHAAKVVSCDGKLLAIWDGCTCTSHNRNGRMKIWCAQIVLEKRDGGEVWGHVEWVDAVQTVPRGCTLLCPSWRKEKEAETKGAHNKE